MANADDLYGMPALDPSREMCLTVYWPKSQTYGLLAIKAAFSRKLERRDFRPIIESIISQIEELPWCGSAIWLRGACCDRLMVRLG